VIAKTRKGENAKKKKLASQLDTRSSISIIAIAVALNGVIPFRDLALSRFRDSNKRQVSH
jgi:hypothetical protein